MGKYIELEDLLIFLQKVSVLDRTHISVQFYMIFILFIIILMKVTQNFLYYLFIYLFTYLLIN